MSERQKACAAACGSNIIFGFSFLASSIAMEAADPLLLLAIRFLLSAVFMTLLILVGVVHIQLKGKRPWRLIPLGLLQPVIYFACENYGIMYTNSSFAGTMIALIPLATLFMGIIFLGETCGPSQIGWAVCSFVGVAIVSLFGSEAGVVSVKGILILVAAVLSNSLFMVLSRRLADEFSAFERTYVMFLMGSAAFILAAAAENGFNGSRMAESLLRCAKPDFAAAVVYLALVSSVLAFLLINYSAGKIEARRSSSFASISTVVSIAAGVIFLGEPFGIPQLAGSILILVGVYRLNVGEAR
ncbi:MAG TPA: DMT family transporter [Candidatus Lachnoclostridium stercorigallinarum]|uniref:DMT family transporter n=1 Tax=Candidatus Lachnoclostridium stercorigallinarum TaxID=2838634 RepID=A0A9D2K702_9FIRM|nr:DMT family transporter [Candidatus Lachnoclostridium stercorigallinarum]